MMSPFSLNISSKSAWLVAVALIASLTMGGVAQGAEINPQATNLTDATVLAAWSASHNEPGDTYNRLHDISNMDSSHREVRYWSDPWVISQDNPWNDGVSSSLVHNPIDGGSFYGRIQNAESLIFSSNTLTMEGWFKLAHHPTSDGKLIEVGGLNPPDSGYGNNDNRIGIRVKDDGEIRLGAQSDKGGALAVNTSIIMPLDEWVHLAYQWDANEGVVKLFINGELAFETFEGVEHSVTEQTVTGIKRTLLTDTSEWANNFVGWKWAGQIADLRISDGLVDQSELGYHYSFVVPEPGTIVLLGIPGAMAMLRRRSRI